MDKLIIGKTKSTPEIVFDPGLNKLSIKGQSYPENSFQFYEPILCWLDEYLSQVEELIQVEIDFHMPYINTSSSKCLMMLLDKLETAYKSGKKVGVLWYYDKENETALECAEDFHEDMTLPFEFRALDEPRA